MNIKYLKYICLAVILLTGANSYAGYIQNVEEVDSFTSMGRGFLGSKVFATTWTHDLAADEGFTPGSALSGSLKIDFGDSWDRHGFLFVQVGRLDFRDDGLLFKPRSDWTVDLGKRSLAKLNKLGQLKITAFTTMRSFSIVDSVLGVNTSGDGNSDGGVSVPEPSSLALLALGLVGLGVCRRKNRLG